MVLLLCILLSCKTTDYRQAVVVERTKALIHLSRRGPCKVRNETETKRNETKQMETKRNKSKRNETDRNETKQIETKRNKTKRNKSKRNEMSCMERQVDIYSINERALKIIRELSNSIWELCNSIKECSYWIESSWIQL